MDSAPLSLSTTRDADVLVVSAVGEVDLSNRQALLDEGTAAAAVVPDGGSFVLDLSGLTFMDSAGLGATVVVLRGASRRGLRVALVVEHPLVVRLVQITGISKAFPVVGTLEQALAA